MVLHTLYGVNNYRVYSLLLRELPFSLTEVPWLSQMPANNTMYSKLVGPRHQGVYNALLESLDLLGTPMTVSVPLRLTGSGFPALWPMPLALCPWPLALGPSSSQVVSSLPNG